MAKYRTTDGIHFKRIEEKETSCEKKANSFNTKKVLAYFLALAACAGLEYGCMQYTFYLDDLKHQPYVDKANENPAGMNVAKYNFVQTYQKLRGQNPDASVDNLLSTARKTIAHEINARPYSHDFYHPQYNPDAPLGDLTENNLVYEDLGLLAGQLSKEDFEKMLQTYAKETKPVLTLGDSKKKVQEVARAYQSRQRD